MMIRCQLVDLEMTFLCYIPQQIFEILRSALCPWRCGAVLTFFNRTPDGHELRFVLHVIFKYIRKEK